jgi:S1 RNA binding domain protein
VLALGEGGKISLSIKKALPAPEKKQFNKGDRGNKNQGGRRGDSRDNNGKNQNSQRYQKPYEKQPAQDFAKNPPPVYDVRTTSDDADFEDMMAKFKASSEERFSDLKHVMDNKRRNPSRRRN